MGRRWSVINFRTGASAGTWPDYDAAFDACIVLYTRTGRTYYAREES